VRHAPGTGLADRGPADGDATGDTPGDVVERARALLAAPALVVVTGAPGSGRSTVLERLAADFRGPVFAGGGLAMLQDVPAFALSRAVWVRLPAHDPALLAEAVRSRVRAGLLVVDDLQWADAATVTAVAALAAHCRVVVALRTPHRLPAEAVEALRAAAAGWLAVPPLDPGAAADLARRTAPGLGAAAVDEVVRRAGGVPLAVSALARHAAAGRSAPSPDADTDQVAYAVATALADLTRPARTAMAALGLLGRPADDAVLGAGAAELIEAGLVSGVTDLTPVSPYVAEVAAGMLDDPARRALHRRLAEVVPAREAARHLAAAGDDEAAYAHAVSAAAAAPTAGERAELLLLACALPGAAPDPSTRVDAARAALAAGRPRAAATVLTTTTPLGVDAAVLRAEALLQLGDPAGAAAAAAPVPDGVDPVLRAARDRVLLLVRLADDPAGAARAAARLPDPPEHPGLRAAVAAVRAATRVAGWEYGLASAAAAAGAAGDALSARWSAWLLVETLAADGRLDEAAATAAGAAAACADDLAYSWQTRFLAAGLWCVALRGGAGADDVVRRAGDLTDRTAPALARAYAVAAAGLVEADGGLLAPARARLSAAPAAPGAAALLDWVAREAAWLDGQPDRAAAPAAASGTPLVDGLRHITARWAAFDAGSPAAFEAGSPLPAVAATLTAWSGDGPFDRAAAAWHDLAVREEVRCLLAAGLHESDPARAVPPLLEAERIAEEAGLVVLLGRARRALRRHAVRRDNRGPRSGDALTERERDVLRLVAQGEPTRRIAGQLGISAETVETHIRAGMRKLGARTRTAAAVLALESLA
jgi:DNA-binding CsgD family transcriptional regulator